MARRTRDEAISDNGVQDSFLDIVANIVGILILLVIVVGIRAAMQPQLEAQQDASAALPQLTQAMVDERASTLRRQQFEIRELVDRAARVAVEAETRDRDRVGFASYVLSVQQELDKQKQQLDETQTERLAIRSALAESELAWQQLMLEKVGLASKVSEPQSLVHTPTPIVRTQSERTLHLRLEHGRVAVVPFDELIDQLDSRSIDAHRRDLRRLGGVGRLGPIDGFALHYALITRASSPGPQGIRQVVTFLAGEVRPADELAGETLDEAMAPGSRLQAAMANIRPQDTIAMLWTYPDSTAQFRELQDWLRERQYSVDLRLLSADAHISFSPEGRKTAAQ